MHVPVTVITGFLGSGKTTLLARLMRDNPRVAVVINELADLPLDHLLVADLGLPNTLVAGGCVCCSAQGQLTETLLRLLARRASGEVPWFERILVETTGVADPAFVAAAVSQIETARKALAIENIVALVDAENGMSQLRTDAEAVAQAAVADVILLSKTDLVDTRVTEELHAALRQINPRATVATSNFGHADTSSIFPKPGVAREARDGGRLTQAVADAQALRQTEYRYAHHRLKSFSFTLEKPITRAALSVWISMLATFKAANLLRVKGILNVEGRPLVIHGIRHLFHSPAYLEKWPSEERRSQLVIIARDMSWNELAGTLHVLDLSVGRKSRLDALGIAEYGRFVELAVQLRG
jgi:G3E family GTPase